MEFFKYLADRREANVSGNATLGKLEARVMEALWTLGEASVQAVSDKIEIPRAYTTIMTTLERLFKKGHLQRRKEGRAFLYSPLLTRQEWERRRAEGLISTFFAPGGNPGRELLVSTLLDVVGQYDRALLDELEREIRRRRKELGQRGRS
jgi:predicted transcriptional regulator